VVCCLNFKGRLAEDLEREGVPVHALGKKPRLDLGALWRLARLMRAERADVVHTHLWTSSFWGRLAALLARHPRLEDRGHVRGDPPRGERVERRDIPRYAG